MMVDEEMLNEERDWAEEERVEFEENLDKDRDGRLDYQEIKDWLVPNETTFFEEEAKHLLLHADTDKVSRLQGFGCISNCSMCCCRMGHYQLRRLRRSLICFMTVHSQITDI